MRSFTAVSQRRETEEPAAFFDLLFYQFIKKFLFLCTYVRVCCPSVTNGALKKKETADKPKRAPTSRFWVSADHHPTRLL